MKRPTEMIGTLRPWGALAVALLLFTLPGQGQQNVDAMTSTLDRIKARAEKKVAEEKAKAAAEAAEAKPAGAEAKPAEAQEPAAEATGDEPELEETPKMRDARETYVIAAWKHREKAFAAQHVTTQIIFVMVVLIVLAGLFFAWLQFHASGYYATPKKPKLKPGESAPPGAEPAPSAGDFSAGPEGLKISSPVVGLIILALSLVFFYLYLKEVYPIRISTS